MERINTDCEWQPWKIYAKLFKTLKLWLSFIYRDLGPITVTPSKTALTMNSKTTLTLTAGIPTILPWPPPPGEEDCIWTSCAWVSWLSVPQRSSCCSACHDWASSTTRCPLGPWPPRLKFGAIFDSSRSRTEPRWTPRLRRLLASQKRLTRTLGSGYMKGASIIRAFVSAFHQGERKFC